MPAMQTKMFSSQKSPLQFPGFWDWPIPSKKFPYGGGLSPVSEDALNDSGAKSGYSTPVPFQRMFGVSS
jgi:hypothetical protein